MKKLLVSLSLIGIFWWLLSITSANSTNCKEVEFSNNITACVNIEDAGTNRRELSTDLDGGSTANLRCDIMTPDNGLRSISSCNGEFTYNGNRAGRIKLWIRYSNAAPIDWEDKPNSNSERTYPQWVYQFWSEEWYDDNNIYNNDSDTDNLYVTASPSYPDENEAIDITIKARDGSRTDENYRETVRFRVQRRDNTNDERITASSSLYNLSQTSYTFNSYDNGSKTLYNLLTLKNDNYDYRLVVYDNDREGYRNFDMGNGYDEDYDNNDTDNFYVISSTSNPNEDQYVDVTVRARDGSYTDDNYRGTIRFKVERKSWSSRITASSSYYTLARTSYTFNSADAGIHEFTNLIKFRNDNYDYRLVIYDNSDNNIEGYKIFYVNDDNNDDDNDGNYDADNFYVSTDDSTPNQYQAVDLTIRARDGSYTDTAYRGSVEFEVRYKQIGNSYRTKTTSLSYYEMKYPYENNGFTFYSSNNGQVTITDFISFKRKGYEYKVVVTDDNNNIDGYKIFTVDDDTTSNNDDTDNLYITTNDSTPTTYQRVNLGIRARDGSSTNTAYRGTVDFEVYYKASGSSTWTKTTSSSYYTIHSSYQNGYTFNSSQNGYITISNFIKFNRNDYSYKVVVYDQDDESIFGEQIFTVWETDTTSTTYGFSSSELNTIEAIYDARDNMIANLKASYPTLRTHTTRLNMSDDLYEEMGKIINNENNREYNNFNSFYEGFLDRYRYTVDIR